MSEINVKGKLKNFFKVKDSTDASVSILNKFIMPFINKYKGAGIHEDVAIGEFFNVHNRAISEVVANRSFTMPGGQVIAGSRYLRGTGDRAVAKGQKMIMVLDRVDKTAKIMCPRGPYEVEYLLEHYEIESIKDYLDVAK